MNSRKHLTCRQKLAQTCVKTRARLANGARMRDVFQQVQARVFELPQAPFRNPSPWRQSGANMHMLPPFFIEGAAAIKHEREFTCPKSPSSALRFCSSQPWPLARPRRAKFSPQQPAQLSAQPQVRSSAALALTLQQVPSLAVPQAPSRPRSNPSNRRACCAARPTKTAVRPIQGGRRFALAPSQSFPAHQKDPSCSKRS